MKFSVVQNFSVLQLAGATGTLFHFQSSLSNCQGRGRVPYVTSCARSRRFPRLTLRDSLEAHEHRNLHTFVPLPHHPVLQKGCQKCQQAMPVTPSPHAREPPGCAGCSVPSTGREEEEMGVPELPSSPQKAAKCTGGRRQVPGSAHPTSQPAGSTTCSPDPTQLLLPLLLCAAIFFLSFRASWSCAYSEKVNICWGEKRVWGCPDNIRKKC